MKHISITLSAIFILFGLMACNFSAAQKNKEVSKVEESGGVEAKVEGKNESSKNTDNNENESKSAGNKIDGVFLRYQISMPKDGELQPKGEIKIYFGDDKLRAESDLNIFSNAKVVLTDTDDSGMGALLFPGEKTYFERNLKSRARNNKMRLYESRFVIGNDEKTEDFGEITTLITSNFYYLKFRPETEDDSVPLEEKEGAVSVKYWLTDEIANTAGINQIIRNKPQILDGLYGKVYQNDLVPVKIEEKKSGKVIRVIELIEHKQMPIAEDHFKIPDGYSVKN